MDGLVVAGHGCFLDGLGHCGVRVARASDVLARSAVLHGESRLVDLKGQAVSIWLNIALHCEPWVYRHLVNEGLSAPRK